MPKNTSTKLLQPSRCNENVFFQMFCKEIEMGKRYLEAPKTKRFPKKQDSNLGISYSTRNLWQTEMTRTYKVFQPSRRLLETGTDIQQGACSKRSKSRSYNRSRSGVKLYRDGPERCIRFL